MADKKISALTAASTPLAGTEVLPIVQSATTVKVSAADVTAGRVVGMKAVSLDSNGSGIPSGGGIVRLSNGYTYVAGSSTGSGIIISNGDGTATLRAISPGGSTGAIEVETGAGALAATFTAAGNLAFVSGKGIDFSATSGSGTSELLADYEEGTFTPTIVYSGTNTPTYASQLGRYTKIGRMVQIQTFLAWNENGSTGTVTLGSLPFTSVTSTARAVPSILSYGLLVVTSSITGFVNSNATTISLFLNDNAATALSATNTDNDQDMYVTVTYEAA